MSNRWHALVLGACQSPAPNDVTPVGRPACAGIAWRLSMAPRHRPIRRGARLKPLVAIAAAHFALIAPATVHAVTSWPVSNCLDDGSAGSLRWVIANEAQDPDVLDLSNLACSKITLSNPM